MKTSAPEVDAHQAGSGRRGRRSCADPRRNGWFARFAAFDVPASSRTTRERLGCQPTGPGLVDDLRQPGLFRALTHGPIRACGTVSSGPAISTVTWEGPVSRPSARCQATDQRTS
ncbi:hypothetical protein CCR97_21555 [Rhodoplanes elegans]|uniref:Uncharacterized protein n=1 Tax=Rhodoplanes elegans TaxID=29408 RepID=A0A327KJ39_9BRAD|nr:hypothetical protein [Rhodoplanes elegans]RAI38507.1 hypothetical protein CH338_12440 [Rhodoplanes elegans]